MKKEESVAGNAEPTSAKAKRDSAKGCAAGQSGAFEQSERASAKGERARHNIAPVFDENSRTLILGSFPSVASRESGFYYGHKHNRFWQVLAAVYGEKVPASIDEKCRFLLRNEIALWDVIADCRIVEHWDVVAPPPERPANPRSRFSSASISSRPESGFANAASVSSLR